MADYYTSASTQASAPSSAWIDTIRSKASKTSGHLSGLGSVTVDTSSGITFTSVVIPLAIGVAAHMLGSITTLLMLSKFGLKK